LLAVVAAVSGLLPVSAELPFLNEKPWLGYFVGFESKDYRFGVTNKGRASIVPFDKNGKPVGSNLSPAVDFLVQEVWADGSTVTKKIDLGSLTTEDSPNDDLEKSAFRGKTSGGASFEAVIEENRGVISLGGRLLDPGKLKQPVRFVIRVKFGSFYKVDNDDRKAQRTALKRISDDRLNLKWTDGKRVKVKFVDPMDATSKEINGPGVCAIRLETDAHRGKRFEFTASENSVMQLGNTRDTPLYQGFYIDWIWDPAKDPEGKARLSFEVK
jgi:hypothetical protein